MDTHDFYDYKLQSYVLPHDPSLPYHTQVVKGSEPIEIRTPPVVQVSLNLAVSIDDFFDPTTLIYNLAFVLKIDVSRIRIVAIVAEDTAVRGRRSLLAASEYNHTTITLEFGEPPVVNISTPESPSVAEEVAMAGGDDDSVDLEVCPVHLYRVCQIT